MAAEGAEMAQFRLVATEYLRILSHNRHQGLQSFQTVRSTVKPTATVWAATPGTTVPVDSHPLSGRINRPECPKCRRVPHSHCRMPSGLIGAAGANGKLAVRRQAFGLRVRHC